MPIQFMHYFLPILLKYIPRPRSYEAHIVNLYHLWAYSADHKLMNFFSNFSQKTGTNISCTLSLMETICMKCQYLFWGKNQKKTTKMSAEILHRLLSTLKPNSISLENQKYEEEGVIIPLCNILTQPVNHFC